MPPASLAEVPVLCIDVALFKSVSMDGNTYLEVFKKSAELDYDSLAKALSVTRTTLINKKGNDKFSDQISEKIIALADLYSYGYEIFEDRERFNKWMLSPNQALGGLAPIEIIDNIYGREEVRNLIGRIGYGVYS